MFAYELWYLAGNRFTYIRVNSFIETTSRWPKKYQTNGFIDVQNQQTGVKSSATLTIIKNRNCNL